MLTGITYDELKSLISKENPFWTTEAVDRLTLKYINEFDARLEEPLRQYINGENPVIFRYGQFSIYQIQHMKKGRSFLTALSMMDAYIKDPIGGKLLILRR